MNLLDLVSVIAFGSPSLPPLPPPPEPLPEVDESAEDRKKRIAELDKKRNGRKSLITNEGGAGGLEGEEDETLKTKLGGK